jgi:hypothetical protein
MPSIIPHLFPTKTVNNCSWDNPGANPYNGYKFLAILNHPDLTTKQQLFLATTYLTSKPNDVAVITANHVASSSQDYTYKNDISGMNFGNSLLCKSVSRSWDSKHKELADVWCHAAAGSKCVIVPRVCNNVSVITGEAILRAPDGYGLDTVPNEVPEPAMGVFVLLVALVATWIKKRA